MIEAQRSLFPDGELAGLPPTDDVAIVRARERRRHHDHRSVHYEQTSLRARRSGRSSGPARRPAVPGTSRRSARGQHHFLRSGPEWRSAAPPTPSGVTRGRRRPESGNRSSHPAAWAISACTPSTPEPPRIMASHLRRWSLPPAMVITVDGGTNWNPLPALDAQMNWGGAFRMRDPTRPDRALLASTAIRSPNSSPSVRAIPTSWSLLEYDSGVFVTPDAGATWTIVSDPFSPTASGTPHIPRPQFAHFDHLADGPDGSNVDIYVGTRGRGVFRIRLAYGPRDKAGGGAGPRPETAGGAGPRRRSDWETTRTKT